MSKYSKYSEFREGKIPHKKSASRVQGAKEDDGRFYRCRHCGYINNINKAATADGFTSGNSYSIEPLGNVPYKQGTSTYYIGTTGKTVLVQNGFNESHSVGIDTNSGCAFCGSLAWR